MIEESHQLEVIEDRRWHRTMVNRPIDLDLSRKTFHGSFQCSFPLVLQKVRFGERWKHARNALPLQTMAHGTALLIDRGTIQSAGNQNKR